MKWLYLVLSIALLPLGLLQLVGLLGAVLGWWTTGRSQLLETVVWGIVLTSLSAAGFVRWWYLRRPAHPPGVPTPVDGVLPKRPRPIVRVVGILAVLLTGLLVVGFAVSAYRQARVVKALSSKGALIGFIGDGGLVPRLAPYIGTVFVLNLEGKKIAASDLDLVNGLRSLESLNLRGTGVTDEGIARLRGFRNLTSIGLANTHVTERGVSKLLHANPAITTINIRGTRVGADGAARIQRRYPPRVAVYGDQMQGGDVGNAPSTP